MASLFKPKIITYRLRDGSYRTANGKRVTRRTPGAVRHASQSKKWYGRFTDGAGRPVRVPLDESKETARRMLAKLSGDAQLAGVGILDPFASHRARPLLEHLEDFRRYLVAKDRVPEYVKKTIAQCRVIIEGCRFDAIGDLQPSAVVEFLADQRSQGVRQELERGLDSLTTQQVAALMGVRTASIHRMVRRGLLDAQGSGRGRRFTREAIEALLAQRRGVSARTTNHYLAAIKHFSRWLVKDRRAPFDLLVTLSRQNTAVDERHTRRALSQEDFTALVNAARQGKPFRGLTGADRATIYVLAAYTGLRSSELGSLRPAAFQLDAEPFTVTVEAAFSKHRRRDMLTLRPDVAAMVRGYMAGKSKSKLLWPGTWTEAGAEMLRADLEAAGIAYVDEAGRFYDFHALRHQFISNLAQAGVHPKAAQELARHSDIRLTMNVYTHLGLRDQAAALDKLPSLPGNAVSNPASTGKARTRRKTSTA
jgi:excisionase family DNA binding protein